MLRTLLKPAGLADSSERYSQGVVIEEGRGFLFIAGQTATDREGNVVGIGDIGAQVSKVFENLGVVLKEAGLGFENLVKITTYLTDRVFREEYNRVRKQFLPKGQLPASTLLIISGLARPEFLIEIEAVAAF
jgi:enamine deaminase RidA (YjgF/YER057c/UK114 family)